MAGAPPFDRRVLVVSGKGGTGKTTVAAALATVAARRGLRTILVEVEGRRGLARLLGIAPPGFAERPGPLGFASMELTAHDALVEYLTVIVGMRRLSGVLRRARVTELATEAVPGFRDVMVAGKLYELTRYRETRAGGDRRPWELVIVDAPPTGQLVPFLRSPTAYRDLIRVGRAARHLAAIDELVRTEARVLLVAVPEEMAVAESIEAAEAVGELGLALGPVVANRVLPPVFPQGARAAGLRLTPTVVSERLASAGAVLDEADSTALLEAGLVEHARVGAQGHRLASLRSAGLPVIELPSLAVPRLGRDEVELLATSLGEALPGSTEAPT
jgi:anion-transporting  ArsA/GET3 family ATPase